MELRIKRFCADAPLPERKTSGAIGYDLPAGASYSTQYRDRWYTSSGDVLVPNHEGAILIPLCWGFEIPPGHVGLLDPRSSTSHWLLSGRMTPRRFALLALAWLPGSITLACLVVGYPFFRATDWLCDLAEKGGR